MRAEGAEVGNTKHYALNDSGDNRDDDRDDDDYDDCRFLDSTSVQLSLSFQSIGPSIQA